MSRVFGIVLAFAVVAGAAQADEDRSAYTRASARLTEQLNATISERVDLKPIAPPAKQADDVEERDARARRSLALRLLLG